MREHPEGLDKERKSMKSQNRDMHNGIVIQRILTGDYVEDDNGQLLVHCLGINTS
jgi:hypothetical protein